MNAPNWTPFTLCPPQVRPPRTRDIATIEGIGDRLRAAAFAEIQAREAFHWAANRFTDAPASLRSAWRGLALAEDKHLGWLLNRMREIGQDVAGRPVSDFLWNSFMNCTTAAEFAWFMANAEERGRVAGERFRDALKEIDPQSAKIFGKIAEEEVEHIALAQRYFPEPR